jgi:hypothetical protein
MSRSPRITDMPSEILLNIYDSIKQPKLRIVQVYLWEPRDDGYDDPELHHVMVIEDDHVALMQQAIARNLLKELKKKYRRQIEENQIISDECTVKLSEVLTGPTSHLESNRYMFEDEPVSSVLTILEDFLVN